MSFFRGLPQSFSTFFIFIFHVSCCDLIISGVDSRNEHISLDLGDGINDPIHITSLPTSSFHSDAVNVVCFKNTDWVEALPWFAQNSVSI